MPYNPTWNNQYLPINGQGSSIGQSAIPSMQQLASGWGQYQQPVNGYQQQNWYNHGRIMADGPTEAYNRLLMMYQPNQLVPGFVSDTVWDVNGRQFYSLSIENDGRRNFEIFDYMKHVDSKPTQIDGTQFVSRQEYDQFVKDVSAKLEAMNGVHAAVPATATAQGTGVPGQDGSVALDVAGGRATADTTGH